jgi:hypothetical protein
MISPTDITYRLLPTSPSARELMDAYTPGLFELKFAEERTRQAAPRVGLPRRASNISIHFLRLKLIGV